MNLEFALVTEDGAEKSLAGRFTAIKKATECERIAHKIDRVKRGKEAARAQELDELTDLLG